MKKLFMMLMLVVGVGMFTACTNKVDKMIDQYEAAIENGDWVEQATIAGQLAQEKLSASQQARIQKLALKALSPENMKKVQDNVMEQVNEYQDNVMEQVNEYQDMFKTE